jgi:hypothetical protein
MKSRKLHKLAKILGVPLFLLAAPLSNISTRLNASRIQVRNAFISSRAASTRRGVRNTFTEITPLKTEDTGNNRQAFSSFSSETIAVQKEKTAPDKDEILAFLDRNGLLFPESDQSSTFSGQLGRKVFADARSYAHCHFSTGVTTTKTVSACTGFGWDGGPPTISGIVASQPVNSDATADPFSGVTIGGWDTNETVDVSFDVQINLPAQGYFSAASLTAQAVTDKGGGLYRSNYYDTLANTQTRLQNLVFVPTNSQAVAGTETTNFTLTVKKQDAVYYPTTNATSDSGTTVISTKVNTPSTITGTAADQAVNDNSTVAPFSGATISDADNHNVSIAIALDDNNKGTLSTSSGFSFGGGVYSYSSNTIASAQAALRGLAFTPAANRVTPGSTETTTFTITVNDGYDDINDSTTTVISTSINDSPTISGTAADQSVSHGNPVLAFALVSISDIDDDNVSVTVTMDNADKGTVTDLSGFANDGGGVYSLASGPATSAQSGIRGIEYTPALDRVTEGNTETTRFTIQVSDGTDTTTDTRTSVVSTAVNNFPPTITGTVADQTVNDDSTLSPFLQVVLDDADNDNISITITLDDKDKGSFTNLSGFTDNGDGSYSFATDTIANAQAALRALTFVPTTNRVTSGSTETTTVTLQVSDGMDTATDNTITIISTAVSNTLPTAPVLLYPVNGGAVTSPVTLVWSPSTDGDGDTISYRISLCENSDFTSCSIDPWLYGASVSNEVDQSGGLFWTRKVYADEVGSLLVSDTSEEDWLMMLVLLSGLSFTALSLKKRRRYLAILILVMLGLACCASGGDSGSSTEATSDTSPGANTLQVVVPDLVSGTTYYWKVTAEDDQGGNTDSEASSFTVQ